MPRLHQRGASLFFSLTALAGLSLAAMAMLRSADTSTMVAGNIGFHGAAVQAADLAVESAIGTIVTLASAGTVGSNNTNAGYYATLDSTAPDAMLPPASRLSDAAGATLSDTGTGNSLRYVIERMCNATGAPSASGCVTEGANPLYRLTARVRGPRNTSETVQSLFIVSVFSPNCAIMTRGSMTIGGTTRFDGTSRCLFSNGSIDMAGTPATGYIGNVAAAGSIIGTSKITGAGGTASPNQPPIVFPAFNTNEYRQYADYIFRADGRVVQTATNTVFGPYNNSSQKWNGWYRESSSPVRWAMDSSTPSVAGLYYFEGNVKVSPSVGTASNLWNVSFIAEGAIQVSGACFFQNYTGNTSAPQNVNNIFMMARGDIELNGNSTAPAVHGLIITNEELKFNGNNRLVGNLIALNANNTDPSGLDSFIDFNDFSGELRLTYNPDAANNLWQPLAKRVQWRTVSL